MGKVRSKKAKHENETSNRNKVMQHSKNKTKHKPRHGQRCKGTQIYLRVLLHFALRQFACVVFCPGTKQGKRQAKVFRIDVKMTS